MHENHELCSLVSFKVSLLFEHNCKEKWIHDDIDNDDVSKAKSPVHKSKRDKKPTKRQSFIYDYDKI